MTLERRALTYTVFQIGNTSYQVDGGNRSMDVPPVIVESRTLMPVRFVVEPLGAKVGWNGARRKVTITLGLKTIELWIDGGIARINGSTIYIDPSNPKVTPFISDSRIYLPVRFVC
ncbi:MAG: copper amine oxidase N-terminal domain-containing protein [Bacillota bacterium]|nr:copper amine oxidase N-terminal domain-containing protein [Bacillota bacterium]